MVANWNSITIGIILLLVHCTIFVSDAITNNFFPFSQIFGIAVHQNFTDLKYYYLNYSYECESTRDCSHKLCLASNIPLANRIILIPISNSRDCSVPDNAWMGTMIGILIFEWILTFLWIWKNKLIDWLERKMTTIVMSYYVMVCLIFLVWGPSTVSSISSGYPTELWAIVVTRAILFVIFLAILIFNTTAEVEEQDPLLQIR